METKTKSQSEKKTKKGYFLPEELDEIQKAMEEEGYSCFSDYVLNMTRTRRQITDAEQRRKQGFNYCHSKMHTLHNKLMANIEPRKTIDEIMMEVDRLCQDLM